MKFDTYKESYEYWRKNKDGVPEGQIMVISTDGHEVRVRSLKDAEQARRDRSADSNSIRGVIKDDLPGGVNGMLSHADGKRYDSKSGYERAVRASGCRVVGNDWNNATYKTPLERGVRGDFNVRPQLKEAVQKVLNG